MNSGQPLAAPASRKSRAKLIIIFLAVLLGISLVGLIWYLKSGTGSITNSNGKIYTEAQVKSILPCGKVKNVVCLVYNKEINGNDFSQVFHLDRIDDKGEIIDSLSKELAGMQLFGFLDAKNGFSLESDFAVILMKPDVNGEEKFTNILHTVRAIFREVDRYKANSGFEYIEYLGTLTENGPNRKVFFAQIDNLIFIQINPEEKRHYTRSDAKETFEYRVERFVKEVQKR